MVSASDFRKGVTFEKDNYPCLIVDFQHVKPGKGAAFVRTKYRNLKTGAIREEAFNPSDKFPKANIETKQMQFLYNDGDLYYFMDNETYDQVPLNYEQVEDAIKFLKENESATIRFYQGQAFQVEAPNFVELEVTDTEPGIKGDTASNVTKSATVETGAVVHVPLFINVGDKVKIDTRTGDYLSRV
ncbi:MAG TPA: elongation factor P [Peptostreptococcaceae bacterium]|jgi:elongation factor P|nr:elongation factor P [Peptostreptococcaceae bacterium]